MIAVLYRPQRVKWDGESDRRIPFTTYGITKRYKEFAEIDDTLIYAIITNYRAMRTASLEEIYTEIFPYKHSFDNEENPNQSSQNENMFSWANVHTNLLGDDLSNESKYLQLNVHTVLNRLNTIIKENRTKKKYHG